MPRDIKNDIIQKAEHGKVLIKDYRLAIEEFEKIIEADEEIVFASRGSISGKNRLGMVFITNKRVVVSLKLLFAHVEQFQYENITAVDYKVNMFGGGEIHITSYGIRKEILFSKGKDGENLRKAVEYIKKKMFEAKQPMIQQVVHNPEPDFITQLERLAKLKEQGILSEDEFQEQKRKLLS